MERHQASPVRGQISRSISASLIAAVAVAMSVAGCSGSSGAAKSTGSAQSSGPSTRKLSGPAALVPASIRSKGTVVVATDATYPPYEYVGQDGKTIMGMDPDIIQAIGKQLNLKISLVNSTFTTIIPGLVDGKYGVGISTFLDTAARQKQVDFVTYAHGESGFYVKAGGKSYSGLASLCGAKVAVENGTAQQTEAQAQAGKCTAENKPTVTILAFGDQNSANLALSSGRADVGFADAGLISYIVKQSNGAFAATGTPLPDSAEIAIALPQGNGMAKAVQAALQAMIKSGEYGSILKKWGTQSEAIPTSMINVAKG